MYLVKSYCSITKNFENAKVNTLSLGFNIGAVEKLEDGQLSVTFSFNQKGFEKSEKMEFLSIESDFQMVVEKTGSSTGKLAGEHLLRELAAKIYPFMRNHHLNVMHAMGLNADLPLDLPQELPFQEQPKSDAGTKSIKKSKKKKSRD